MRRNAAFLLVVSLISTSAGCSLYNKIFPQSAAAGQPNLSSSDMYNMPADSQSYPTEAVNLYEPATTQTATTLAASTNQNAYSAGATSARYHIVTKQDTLYGIARMHYGDQRRWKEIYAANRNEIVDPNMIRVGQRLLIP